MPVTTHHRDYDRLLPQWQRLRDAFAGRDAVKHKERRESYVPRLEGQTDEYKDDYEKYIGRALWTGYSTRTLTGLVGAVFRKDPQVTFPPLYEEYLEDVTLTGQPFVDFARETFREVMAMNWLGVLVDMPTAEEAAPDERRPLLRRYRAEDITNWRIETRQGQPTLVQLVLAETFEEPAEDGFGSTQEEQYRVLSLTENRTPTLTGPPLITQRYTQQLWRKQKTAENKEEWLPYGAPIVPLRREEPLQAIPFFPVSANGVEFRLQPSRLLDLVDVNYDHFRLDADYKHGLHFTALPTAWLAGFPTDAEYRIGSQVAWVSDNPQARAGFTEFTGAGLGAIMAAKESDERTMAVLGARLLEESKRAVEAAETIQLRQAGEESIVKTAARTVSSALEQALWLLAWWTGLEDPEVQVQLNTDIVAAQMSPAMLTTLLGALQAGAISQRTFLESLVTGEIVQGRTWEEEQELIALTTPPTLRGLPPIEEEADEVAA